MLGSMLADRSHHRHAIADSRPLARGGGSHFRGRGNLSLTDRGLGLPGPAPVLRKSPRATFSPETFDFFVILGRP